MNEDCLQHLDFLAVEVSGLCRQARDSKAVMPHLGDNEAEFLGPFLELLVVVLVGRAVLDASCKVESMDCLVNESLYYVLGRTVEMLGHDNNFVPELAVLLFGRPTQRGKVPQHVVLPVGIGSW